MSLDRLEEPDEPLSDTPRTDAVTQRELVDESDDRTTSHHWVTVVPADFARSLERENTRLRQELALAMIPTTVDAVEREEWRQERKQLRDGLSMCKEALGIAWTTLSNGDGIEEWLSPDFTDEMVMIGKALSHPAVKTLKPSPP